MPTARPFAYNTGSTISGTVQIGNLAVGYPTIGFEATGLQWWNGPDEDLGYVIARPNALGARTSPTGILPLLGFIRSTQKTDESFLELATLVTSGETFSHPYFAKIRLEELGYWSSWEGVAPSPTPTQTPTQTPTNTITPSITPTNTPTPTITPTITPTNTQTPTPTPPPITDGSGNVYQTVTIGSQVWLNSNLRTTKLNNGVNLDNTSPVDNATWSAANDSSTRYWAYVANSSGNTLTYGLVYNQYAAQTFNLCPSGYHVPTAAEFTTLVTFLGGDPGTKAKSTTLWVNNANGTNSSGFNGRPAGYRTTNGVYSFVGESTYYWSVDDRLCRGLDYRNTSFDQYSLDSIFGFSVRCLKN